MTAANYITRADLQTLIWYGAAQRDPPDVDISIVGWNVKTLYSTQYMGRLQSLTIVSAS